MSLRPLTIIPAGAGSGKTYSIQQRLGEWVADGRVAPERIVAVTFTEAAATELRERISAKLLDMQRVEDALRLDQAYISTIHGFGLRVLTEFSFEAGSSPRPRLLNEDEQNALIRLALARTDRVDEITADLGAFGYSYDHNSAKTAEDAFRDDLLRMTELLRSVGWEGGDAAQTQATLAWIAERYGETGDGAQLSEALRRSVAALLAVYPESLEREHGGNATAAKAFREDYQNLRRATHGDALDTDWQLWKKLRALRLSKRGNALPEDYDRLGSAVIAAADALPRHPGPLAHAGAHVDALLSAAHEVLLAYTEAKRTLGLVDYTDMIAMTGQLLRQRPDVLETLVSRIDCLVIDEFQDTNPLQFDLLWQIKEAGVPTLVVGDLKQAIMGFQGADPRLLEALEQQNREDASPLTLNWRSQPDLMAFVNAVGPTLFGDAYVTLAPQRPGSLPVPLEVIRFATAVRSQQHAVRAHSVGARIQALLDDPEQKITDRRTKQPRGLRGGDVAVLCPTHNMLAIYADVLRGQGLRVRLQASGWMESRIIQIAWHALCYLANPADRHAALYLAVTELGSLSLEDALRQLMDDGRVNEPLLARLDALSAGVEDRTVYALVADVIAALELFGIVALWPDGEQARANLLRLQAESGEFMDANREALSSGGFHGSGVQTFLAWLAARVAADDDQPEPRVLDEDAVVLTTWHSAKGREWPVVAVCGLDRAVNARLPDVGLGYDSFEDLARLIERARIEYVPAFAAPETNDRFLQDLQAQAETEARRLLYVAITRARDKLMLEWPEYKSGKKGCSYWSLLSGDGSLVVGDDEIRVDDEAFACHVIEGGAALPEGEDVGDLAEVVELPRAGRRAIRAGQPPQDLTPDSSTPSAMAAEKPAAGSGVESLIVERYGGTLQLDTDLTGAALGSLLHRCFEVLGARSDLAERLTEITGTPLAPDDARAVSRAVTDFESWLDRRFSPRRVLRELPLLSLDARGTVISGVADVVVESENGVWIIDHKSDQIDDPAEAFSRYIRQLEAYAGALAGEGLTVSGVGINWIRRGEIVLLPSELPAT